MTVTTTWRAAVAIALILTAHLFWWIGYRRGLRHAASAPVVMGDVSTGHVVTYMMCFDPATGTWSRCRELSGEVPKCGFEAALSGEPAASGDAR